jgi:1,4-alpha-glucan branching enzyme
MKPRADVLLILHAHLPYVRRADAEASIEELWFYQAVLECYLPLVLALERLARDGVPTPFALSLSPTLLTMMVDPLLQQRLRRHLDLLIRLSRGIRRAPPSTARLRPAIDDLHRRLLELRRELEARDWNLVPSIRALERATRLELMTCAATHALLPLYRIVPGAVRTQIAVGLDTAAGILGARPRGFWLPECGFHPDVDEALAAEGVRFTIVESHALRRADPPLPPGAALARTPAGTVVLARDRDLSRKVWSAEEGYPGDPVYREFHRDAGMDFPDRLLGPWFRAGYPRAHTGLKYWRVTDRLSEHKRPYRPTAAAGRAAVHARNFLRAAVRRAGELAPADASGRPALVLPFDAELFGHWWYEGPAWIETLFRSLHAEARVRASAPSERIRAAGDIPTARPAPSTWGRGGHCAVWLEGEAGEVLPDVLRVQREMDRLARIGGPARAASRRGRALRQATREALLAAASDWPFLLASGGAADVARARLAEHARRFRLLADALRAGRIPEALLDAVERLDMIFETPAWRTHGGDACTSR